MNKNENKQKSDKKDDLGVDLEEIKEISSVTISKGKHNIFCLTVIGEIEGHTLLSEQTKTTKYEHVIPQLIEAEENEAIDGVLIILNTVGGDVEAGLALAELISGMSKPTVSFVLGGGHSIGVPLAVAAKKSFIAPSATMTIHPVRMNGLVIGVPQMMNHFERMQKRITDFVSSNSKISKSEFSKLLMNTNDMVTDVGSVLDGNMAVEYGIIDAVGSLKDVISSLHKMIESNK